jgi:hypothetical protein
MCAWNGAHGVQPPLTDVAVREAEEVLGVRLPAALLDLLRIQNGGGVASGRRTCPAREPTSWAADHVPFEDLPAPALAADFRSFVEGLTL